MQLCACAWTSRSCLNEHVQVYSTTEHTLHRPMPTPTPWLHAGSLPAHPSRLCSAVCYFDAGVTLGFAGCAPAPVCVGDEAPAWQRLDVTGCGRGGCGRLGRPGSARCRLPQRCAGDQREQLELGPQPCSHASQHETHPCGPALGLHSVPRSVFPAFASAPSTHGCPSHHTYMGTCIRVHAGGHSQTWLVRHADYCGARHAASGVAAATAGQHGWRSPRK